MGVHGHVDMDHVNIANSEELQEPQYSVLTDMMMLAANFPMQYG